LAFNFTVTCSVGSVIGAFLEDVRPHCRVEGSGRSRCQRRLRRPEGCRSGRPA
jgi:hypothetical protein